MAAVLKGLFRWSLEITGVSIIWYNYQPYEKQQKLIGVYNFARNSYRFSRCLLALSQDFKQYQLGKMDQQAIQWRADGQTPRSRLKRTADDSDFLRKSRPSIGPSRLPPPSISWNRMASKASLSRPTSRPSSQIAAVKHST